jgi:NAD(P)H-hydrate epimerase
VTLLAVESDKPLPEEAQAAREAWLNAGGVIHAAISLAGRYLTDY